MLVEHVLVKGSTVDAAEDAEFTLVGLLGGVRTLHVRLQVMLQFVRLATNLTSPWTLV